MAELTQSGVIAELRRHKCRDPIQAAAIGRAVEILAASKVAEDIDGLDLLVLDPQAATPELIASRHYVGNCRCLIHEGLVIVNLAFLAEMEGALRAFASAGSFYGMRYLEGDAALFELVRALRPAATRGARWIPDPWRHLKRPRGLTSGYGAASREGEREEDLREELALLVFFFLAHEVGHILGRHGDAAFGAFLPPGGDLETDIADAVVRLARHADDFARHDHDLPGFGAMNDLASPVRAAVERHRAALGRTAKEDEDWFEKENEADRSAHRLIEEHLGRVAEEGAHALARAVFLQCRGIFAAALYGWYADLLSFYDALGIPPARTAQGLVAAMTQHRRNYIHAASLFGGQHRNTLLRGEIAIGHILETCTSWSESRTWKRSTLSAPAPETAGDAAREHWWLEETVLRLSLLAIVVDTAVKMAYVGAATSWIVEIGAVRKPLIINFESIDQAVERIARIARGNK